MIREQEPMSAFGVRRSFEQLNLTSLADSFFETEPTCFDLSDDLKMFEKGGEGYHRYKSNFGALQTVSYEQILAISLFTEARLSLIANRVRAAFDEDSFLECKTPF